MPCRVLAPNQLHASGLERVLRNIYPERRVVPLQLTPHSPVPDLRVGQELDADLAVVVGRGQLGDHGQVHRLTIALDAQDHLPPRVVPADALTLCQMLGSCTQTKIPVCNPTTSMHLCTRFSAKRTLRPYLPAQRRDGR